MIHPEIPNPPPQYTWQRIESIYNVALSKAPAHEDKNKNYANLPLRKAYWDRWKQELPLEIVFMPPAPDFGHLPNIAIDGNTLLTPSAEAFFALLLFTRSEQQGRFLDDPILHSQCTRTLKHEDAHRTTVLQYGADWAIYGITIERNFYNGYSSGRTITPHIRICGTIPIEGFVRMNLAPDTPSIADLANVGLTQEAYEDIIARGADPIDEVLRPWREAGMI